MQPSVEEKCLWETPIEASFIERFNESEERVKLLETVKEKYGDALHILSFGGNEYVVERAIDALVTRNRTDELYDVIDTYLEIYKKYSLQNILSIQLKNEEVLQKAWPIYVHGHDKYGHPVFYDELLNVDLHEVINVFSETVNGYNLMSGDKDDAETCTQTVDEYEHDHHDDQKVLDLCCQFRLKFYAKMADYKRAQSDKCGETIFKHILVMDLKNFSYYKVAANLSMYSQIAKHVLTTEQLLFPQTVYKIFLINSPWTFTLAWKVISTFIDPLTLKKIKILGSNFLDEMVKDIAVEQIPKKYVNNEPEERL